MELLFSDWGYIGGLAMLAGLCTFGTLYEGYDDNLGERCGMAAMAFGALGEINAIYHGLCIDSPVRLMVFGILTYTASAIYPLVRKKSCGSSKL